MNFLAKIASLFKSSTKSFDSWLSLFGGSLTGSGSAPAKFTKPYAQSTWVFAAIQKVAAPIAARQLRFEDIKGQPVQDPEGDVFWKRPAVNVGGKMSRNDFFEASVAWMLLSGQAYWILDDTWFGRGTPSPIYLCRPDRISPIRNGDKIIAWNFIDADMRSHVLAPEQVVTPSIYNPYDEALGLAPMLPALVAAQSDYAAGVLAKNVMEANGDRGAYVIAKNGVVTDDQRKQIEAMLRNKRELARRGEFKTAFLTGDITVEDPKVQAMDAQFVAQRIENRHEIFAAFGVPMSMADITASYSVGSASDRFILVEETCMPIGAKLCRAVDVVERLRTSLDRESKLSWDDHSTMQQVRQERAGVAGNLWKCGVPMKELNDWLDLGLPEYEGWDKGFLPMSMVEVGGSMEKPKAEPKPQDQAKDENAKIMGSLDRLKSMFEQGPMRDVTPAPKRLPGCDHHHKDGEDVPDDADEENLKLWRQHMKMRAPHEKAVAKQYQKWCHEMRSECLQNLETGKALAGITQRGILEVLFDLAAGKLRLNKLLKGPLTQSVEASVKELGEEIGAEDPWTMEADEVLRTFEARQNKINGAAETAWNEIKQTLQEGMDAGESNAKLANRIRETFDGISKERAKTIANTEVAAAYGVGRQEAMKGNGVKYKEWLTAGDDKVRAMHVRANGQQVPIDEPFEVDGEKLMHPGDPDGKAENVINCRCVAIAIRKPKEEAS